MKAALSLLACSITLFSRFAAAQSAEPALEPTKEPTNGELPPAPLAVPAVPSAELERPEAPAPRYDFIRLNAGLKLGYVATRGFDTFASNDVLAQFSVDATYPLLTRGKLVLAAGAAWDVGNRSDPVRGFSTSLTTHRVHVPIEARLHFAPWIYGFGKVAPGVAAMVAEVRDGATGHPLAATGWAFSADASVGASFLVGPTGHYEKRKVRVWATPEVGWALTTEAALSANPDRKDSEILGSDENTKLRSLALSGFFWRASLGVAF